ncbi:hypothetical protein D3C85_1621840 [compost metagenome]
MQTIEISSTVANLFKAVLLFIFSRISTGLFFCQSVSTKPGAIVFTVTFLSAKSLTKLTASAWTAALVTA